MDLVSVVLFSIVILSVVFGIGQNFGERLLKKKLTKEISRPYRDDDPMRNEHRIEVRVVRRGNKIRYIGLVPGSTRQIYD
ncbi:MAG: hypothetical protein WCV59_00380 [Parcubacteria group bacterium]